MLGWIGYSELLVVMAIVLLLFGSSKLPLLMRSLGRSATEFKRGMREDPDADGNSTTEEK